MPKHDWIEHYVTHMPKIRNLHAHGTDMLYPTVLHSFHVVADFINQEFLSFLREIDKAVPVELDVHCIVDNYATHSQIDRPRSGGRSWIG